MTSDKSLATWDGVGNGAGGDTRVNCANEGNTHTHYTHNTHTHSCMHANTQSSYFRLAARLVLASQLSEHGPRIESCEISEFLCKNSENPRRESRDLSFFKNTQLFSECVFVPLPSVADSSEFALYY